MFGDALGLAQSREGLRQEAYMWITGRWESALTFEDVCDGLGINPNDLRPRCSGCYASRLSSVKRMITFLYSASVFSIS